MDDKHMQSRQELDRTSLGVFIFSQPIKCGIKKLLVVYVKLMAHIL